VQGYGSASDSLERDPAGLSAAALFRLHCTFVAGFLVRLGVEAQDVDDLVQEVFLIAHRQGGYVLGPARPTTWLAEIALRVASVARRSRRRSRVSPDEATVASTAEQGAGPFEAAAASQALGRVQRALDTLDLDRRAVFVLFELEGESCDVIAAGLGIPVSTVYSRLHAARQAFRTAYDRENRVEASGAKAIAARHRKEAI